MFKPFEEDENVAFGDFDFNLPQSLVEELEQGWAGKFIKIFFRFLMIVFPAIYIIIKNRTF